MVLFGQHIFPAPPGMVANFAQYRNSVFSSGLQIQKINLENYKKFDNFKSLKYNVEIFFFTIYKFSKKSSLLPNLPTPNHQTVQQLTFFKKSS